MKKLIALLLMAIVSCASFVAGGIFATKPVEKASASTITGVDVYFIAGQSNAAGCSDFYRGDASDKTAFNLTGEWREKAKQGIYTNGFNNVWYFGFAGVSSKADAGTRFLTELVPVKVAQGSNYTNEFGPELGMAEYFSKHYGPGSENPNRQAVIIKYAVGAASLIGEKAADWCSWCAPTYRKNHNITPFGNDLYYELVGKNSDQADGVYYKALSAIKAKGFTDVDLKGFYWSQGEAECNSSDYTKHGEALEALIVDLRKDFNTASQSFVKANSGVSVDGASDLDFLISEIAPTFATNSKRADGQSNNFHIREVVRQQKAVASKLSNVYTLPTQNYVITNKSDLLKSDLTGTTESYCGDKWHYSADDMLDIGNNAARTLCGVNSTQTTSLRINVNAESESGMPIEVDQVSLVCGKTYTAQVNDGVAIFSNLPVGNYEVKVEGFNHVGEDNKYLANYYVEAKQNTTVSDTINIKESAIAIDGQTVKEWTLQADKVHGDSITSYNTPRTEVLINNSDAKGVSFKYNYYANTNSTYFPYVTAIDENGVMVHFQFCHWQKWFGIKLLTSESNTMVTKETITNELGYGSLDCAVWFEGKTIHYKVSNVKINDVTKSSITNSYDVSTINSSKFTGNVQYIALAYGNDVGKSGSLEGKGTGDQWNMYDIQPILKTVSSQKSTVVLDVVAKNIRGVNGVSDARVEGKTAVLSSAGG